VGQDSDEAIHAPLHAGADPRATVVRQRFHRSSPATRLETLRPGVRWREPTTSLAPRSRANSAIRHIGAPSRISVSAGTRARTAVARAVSSARRARAPSPSSDATGRPRAKEARWPATDLDEHERCVQLGRQVHGPVDRSTTCRRAVDGGAIGATFTTPAGRRSSISAHSAIVGAAAVLMSGLLLARARATCTLVVGATPAEAARPRHRTTLYLQLAGLPARQLSSGRPTRRRLEPHTALSNPDSQHRHGFPACSRWGPDPIVETSC
jgi:hypothetical protein